MGRSQESFNKKEVRNKKEKKRKEKEKKRLEKKEKDKNSLDDMIAYVDEFGNILDSPPDPQEKEEIKPEDIEISVPKNSGQDLDPIREGTVTFFDDSRGFGFIRDSETKEDVFVHVNDIKEDIKQGNRVQFEVGSGPKGPIAINVKILS